MLERVIVFMRWLMVDPLTGRCVACQNRFTGKIVCAHAEGRGGCPCECHKGR